MNKRNLTKRFKKISMIALTAAFVLSTSLVPSGINSMTFNQKADDSIVHAASDNLVDFRDEKPQNQGVFNLGITSYQMGVHVDFQNPDAYSDLRVTWKIPEEMAVDMHETDVARVMTGYSNVSTAYLDENGERVSSSEVDSSPYISIDADNRTLEYNLSALMDDHNLRLDDSSGTPTALLSIEIAAYNDSVNKGTYPVQLAVTEGPADPANVAGAYEFNFEVTEGPEEPEEPEVDKSGLEATINEAKNFNADEYTDDSFATLTAAVEAGEGVLADEDATQDEVNEAIAAIESAVNGLVKDDEDDGDVALDLEASIEGDTKYDSKKHYYLLNVTVNATNISAADVNDVYAGFALPQGVQLLDEDETPAEVNQLILEDGSVEVAVKLPELEAGENGEVSYQIPVIGQTDAIVEASSFNTYAIDGNEYLPLGQFDGSIFVDYSNMDVAYYFDAKAQIVKDFPDVLDNEFGLRFSFNTQNLTLEEVSQVVVEFEVPDNVTIHSPDSYESGEIPDSLKDFLDDEGLSTGNLDIEWDGNKAIINLDDVPGTQWNQGFFTAIGESNVALEELEGANVLVTLLRDGTEVVEEINVPFEIVSYQGETPEDPKDPEDPEDPKDPEDPEDPEEPEHPETPENPEEPGDDKDGDNGEVVVEVEDEDDEGAVDVTTSDGDQLPQTATSTFNLMLGGLLMILAGAGSLFFTQRRRMSIRN